MKRTPTWTAEDGTTFSTRIECRRYEETQWLATYLSDLTPIHIKDALYRINTDLADALERAGNIVAGIRRAQGEGRRPRRGSIDAVANAMKERP